MADQSAPSSISLSTVVRYLFGDHQAIIDLASNRQTLWLGLLLVFSAGLAREYDGEDLLYEPWHLLIPVGASLATSLILFSLVAIVAAIHGAGFRGIFERYCVFLGLYWMTAPLAWIYAIPVEQFLSAGNSVAANLWLLAIVSAWRVWLITRVIAVLFHAPPRRVFPIVMLFADVLALILISYLDVQIFAAMGGVKLNDVESTLAEAKVLVNLLGFFSLPVWCWMGLVTMMLPAAKDHWRWIIPARVSRQVDRRVWWVAGSAVSVLILVLPLTQPSQQLRRRVERDLHAGRYAPALATMSAYQPQDFPRHWDPPPSIGADRERHLILKVLPNLQAETAPWVRRVFLQKFEAALGRNEFTDSTLWYQAEFEEIVLSVSSLPEGIEILKKKSDAVFGHVPDAKQLKDPEAIHRSLLSLISLPPDPQPQAGPELIPYEWTSSWHEYLQNLHTLQRVGPIPVEHLDRVRDLVKNQDKRERVADLIGRARALLDQKPDPG